MVPSNRLQKLFAQDAPVLSVFTTAGFPDLKSTRAVLRALQNSGVHLVELGIPFSDPLADGPVIQQSSQQAILNGMTIERLFEDLNGFREEIDIPVFLMGYLNNVLQYGVERFLLDAQQVGVDGVILPDLPLEEFESDFQSCFEAAGIAVSFLITPETPDERVRALAAASTGFLYVVSSSSTTGGTASVDEEKRQYFTRIRSMNLGVPCLVGFGISDKASFALASEQLDGAIVGSAFIRMLGTQSDIEAGTQGFVAGLLSDDH